MKATTLARIEGAVRPLLVHLPLRAVVKAYSKARRKFPGMLGDDLPRGFYNPPKELERTLWDLTFRAPIMNAAGMFKDAEGYSTVARQGAGGYIGGTGTWFVSGGNKKDGITQPFVPYPHSGSASNSLGLPNAGDATNSFRASQLPTFRGVPLGWSLTYSPDARGERALQYLIEGLRAYERADVDFLELNESCPNIPEFRFWGLDLPQRLGYVKEHFLNQRSRRLPVIVKFSVDARKEDLPELLDMLFDLGFDGINLGNTSTDYAKRREAIHWTERGVYDDFTQQFGGGISGRPIKEDSLALAALAVEYLKKGGPSQEFHVIRTGGIEGWKDIQESEAAGISLNHWFTGYFAMLSKHGHDVYRELFSSLENKTIFRFQP